MKKKIVAVLLFLATTFVFFQTSAEARGYRKRPHHVTHHTVHRTHAMVRSHRGYRAHRFARRHVMRTARTGATGRPGRWCGWWLARHLGTSDRSLWIARNWASAGSNAGGPGIGVVVVWRNHVGIITGRAGSQWIVKSGNDGNAVRERPRSIAGAVAFRHVGGGASI
jgi:hypothetical protein